VIVAILFDSENRELMQDIINGNVKYEEEKEDEAPSEQATERSSILKIMYWRLYWRFYCNSVADDLRSSATELR
jgi:hypothetical protein